MDVSVAIWAIWTLASDIEIVVTSTPVNLAV